MKILILGGTRFTGPHIIRNLIEWGHEVTVFHRGKTEAELPPGAQHLHGDRKALAAHRDAFTALAPDVVVDMLAFTAQDAQSLIAVFDGLAGRAVVASSIDVYRAYGRLRKSEPGPPDLVPLLEDDPLREKLSPEGEAYDKVGVERIVANRPTLPATILRLPMIYGPNDAQHRLFEYLKRMDDGRPAILLSESYAPWRFPSGYCEDVGYAIALAAKNKKAEGRIYNVADAFAFTMEDWVRAIGRAAGWEGEIVRVPNDKLPAHLAPDMDTEQHLIVDSSRIRQELGYQEQVPINEALRRTVEWERANPPSEIDPAQFDYAVEDAILASLQAEAADRSRPDGDVIGNDAGRFGNGVAVLAHPGEMHLQRLREILPRFVLIFASSDAAGKIGEISRPIRLAGFEDC